MPLIQQWMVDLRAVDRRERIYSRLPSKDKTGLALPRVRGYCWEIHADLRVCVARGGVLPDLDSLRSTLSEVSDAPTTITCAMTSWEFENLFHVSAEIATAR